MLRIEPTQRRTVGWTPGGDCPETQLPVPCTVLDPFAGIGTTGVVARRLGRSFVGIELAPRFLEEAHRRLLDAAAVAAR